MMVFVWISSVMAVAAEKMAMNKPARKSVDSPNSLRSLLSSPSEYIVIEGLMINNSITAIIMTA